MFLCGENDAALLDGPYDREKLNDYIRLSFVSLALGFRRFFLSIMANAESDVDNFLNGIDKANRDFKKVDGWVTEFVKNIEYADARNFIDEFWKEARQEIDPEVSIAKQFIKLHNGEKGL